MGNFWTGYAWPTVITAIEVIIVVVPLLLAIAMLTYAERKGDVRQILPDYELDSVDVHALYPAARGPRPRFAPSPTISPFPWMLKAGIVQDSLAACGFETR
jgi:hypothetical protein